MAGALHEPESIAHHAAPEPLAQPETAARKA
jgi:hypothetical protein